MFIRIFQAVTDTTQKEEEKKKTNQEYEEEINAIHLYRQKVERPLL